MVTATETRREKRAGVDDVCLVTLEPGGRIQVDAKIYPWFTEGSRIVKEAGARTLTVDGSERTLAASEDHRAMRRAMPWAAAIAAIVAALALRRRPRASRGGARESHES